MERMQHYLLTYMVDGGHLHGYLMTRYQEDLSATIHRLAEIAEEYAGFLPLVLSTKLTTGVELVQSIIAAHFPQAAKKFKVARERHLTAWFMPHDELDDKRLMELH